MSWISIIPYPWRNTSLTEVLDQVSAGGGLTYLGAPTFAWQSFKPGVSGSLSALDFATIEDDLDGKSYTIQIYEGEGTGGTLLGGGTFSSLTPNPIPDPYYWIRVDLASPIPLTSGNTYTIYWTSSGGQYGPQIAFTQSGDIYPDGRMDLLETFDYVFRTYMLTPA